MKAQNLFRTLFARVTLATVALGGFLLLAGAPGATANDWDDCHRPYAYSNWRYHEAIERREARERAAFERHQWREHHRDRDYRYGWDRR